MDGAFGLVLDKKRRILLVKRRDYPIWVMPGGRLEEDETPEEAVVREVLEESGFKVKIVRKIAEYFVSSTRTAHFFECSIVSGKATPSKESSKVGFFDTKNLPEPINPQIFEYLGDYKLRRHDVIKKPNPKISGDFAKKFFKSHPITSIRYLLTKIGIRINV